MHLDTLDSEYSKSSDPEIKKGKGKDEDPESCESSCKHSSDLSDEAQDINPTIASYDFTLEELDKETANMSFFSKIYFFMRLYLWNRCDHIQSLLEIKDLNINILKNLCNWLWLTW